MWRGTPLPPPITFRICKKKVKNIEYTILSKLQGIERLFLIFWKSQRIDYIFSFYSHGEKTPLSSDKRAKTLFFRHHLRILCAYDRPPIQDEDSSSHMSYVLYAGAPLTVFLHICFLQYNLIIWIYHRITHICRTYYIIHTKSNYFQKFPVVCWILKCVVYNRLSATSADYVAVMSSFFNDRSQSARILATYKNCSKDRHK